MVLPTLLCACETQAVYWGHAQWLIHFHMSRLCKLLKIRWQDKVLDTDILSSASLLSVRTLLMKAQTRWALFAIPDLFMPKLLVYPPKSGDTNAAIAAEKTHFSGYLRHG
ncbi:hypothetical protein NDU88_010348 [Pleurodeles waltl]|uniref:Secreted protein n=1 Tax=Pleurodeles waltl TaxID=8319 RepID=A0AAV7QU90_PLEWA|nr:hypothetical protein NDU88_010348 [Pleurodeles waltl]